ncbi:MAG: hypothetical protein IJD01_00280 [Clostridia bacterium]|nr:hypothetical protein [Clostridia bacterium]
MNMKKRRFTGIGMLLIVLVGFAGCGQPFVSDKPIEVSGNVVDNDLNNFIAGGNLVRIGDALYYNYNQTDACARMKLSADGATPDMGVTHKGFNSALGLAIMRKHQDCIVYRPSDDPLSEQVPFVDIFFQETDSACVYLRYKEEELPAAVDRTAALVIFENGFETVLAEDVILWKFYVAEDTVYYFKSLGHRCELRKHDLRTHTDEAVVEHAIRQVPFECFAVGSNVVFSLHNGVYLATLDEGGTLTHIKNGFTSLNVYNRLVYMAAEDGVSTYDPTTGKTQVLCTRPATECYILDDTWVYFVSDNDSLWRVSQDGRTEEHVYG